jgi:hypothetical protein
MQTSVKATIILSIISLVLMVLSGVLSLYPGLPFALVAKLFSSFVGFGVLLIACLAILQYQWHQPMYKEH